jgi:hypothetical protein
MSIPRGQLPGAAPVPRADASPGNGQVRRPAGRLARQRRPGWIAAGVALLALALLANVYLFQSSSRRLAVVRVARDVPIGQEITRADLDTASVALDGGVATIPGRQLAQVVGRRAAVDLRRGTLLTASQVTAALTPQLGQALVTVGLKASELPPRGLAPGSRVRLVPTTGGQDATAGTGQSGAGQGGEAVSKDVPATVDAVGGPDADGAMTVSLLVADADSSAVARQASAGRIALVITTREG